MMSKAWLFPLLLATCTSVRAQVPESSPPVAPDFARCLVDVRRQALAAGVSDEVFETHVRNVSPDLSVLPLLDAQPEFTTPIWDYLAGLVDDERVSDGHAMLQAHADTLTKISATYGVDPHTVVAVWGVESNFGRNFGKRPLLTSLATLSCMGRRQAFFRGELISALQIVQSGDVPAEALVGSWAGAFGHTQFMPSTFQRIAVDFDGDGRRDLVGNVADALASTAHYLKRAGWKAGQPWGFEVRLPEGFDTATSGRTSRQPLSAWLARGVARADGQRIDLDPTTSAALLLPAGRQGPAFLVFRNYHAIYAYNAAESYALAIALLSDRLRGQGGLRAAWPTQDPGLSRKDRRELQTLLLARGHAIGEADGIIGAATRAAIQVEQRQRGIEPADGRAGLCILQLLRAVPPGAASY